MKRILLYLKPFRLRMLVGFIIKVTGTMAELVLPYILTHILENVIVEQNGGKIRIVYNDWEVPEGVEPEKVSTVGFPFDKDKAKQCGHSGGDYYVGHEFISCILEGRQPYFNAYAHALCQLLQSSAGEAAFTTVQNIKSPISQTKKRESFMKTIISPPSRMKTALQTIPAQNTTQINSTSEKLYKYKTDSINKRYCLISFISLNITANRNKIFNRLQLQFICMIHQPKH